MPTGYTADIAKGITFPEFVWTCARAFGALIMMRDEPHGAPIPQKFEPAPFYAENLAKAEAELARLKGLTPEQANAESIAEHRNALRAWEQRKTARAALREKYEAMIAQAEAWTPPTPEHENLRTFMLQQLRDSVEWDCSDKYDREAPAIVSTGTWLAGAIAEAERSVAYARKSHAEELERTEGRNAWLAALRESVPQPQPQRGADGEAAGTVH